MYETGVSENMGVRTGSSNCYVLTANVGDEADNGECSDRAHRESHGTKGCPEKPVGCVEVPSREQNSGEDGEEATDECEPVVLARCADDESHSE